MFTLIFIAFTNIFFFYFLSSQIHQIVSSFCSSLHTELQQRGVEFSKLFGKYSHLTSALLERMPPIERNQNEAQVNGEMENGDVRVIDDSPQHVDRGESVNIFVLSPFVWCVYVIFFVEFFIGFVGW